MRTMAAVPWESVLAGMNAKLVFVTLTYRNIPRDGRLVKRHLAAFAERWRRRLGMTLGAWKLEFQRRGAAHFHLALVVPGDIDLVALRAWTSSSWTAIVSPGDLVHLSAGTNVQELRGNFAGYFAKYTASPDKRYQHEVPEDFTNVGRWWGLWGVAPEWEVVEVSKRAFCSMRRVLRSSLARKSSRFRRADSRLQGLWVMSREDRAWASFLAAYVLGLAPPGRPPWGSALRS